MGYQQDTIIYIEDQDKLDASAAVNAFADKNIRNRAYINTLGAELALKYLASENINVSDIFNIHSIKKILEELDISDVMLPNIHIDVRVVFDENVIFIPKSHFKYNLIPDIYLVFNLAKDFSHVKFLGFFEPKMINKNNQNNDYYFIEKEKLNPVSDLKTYIENYNGNTATAASEKDIENSERIIMAMSDNDISEDEKQYLIKQLTKSAELRDKFIEYENFETLSYKAMTDPQINRKEPQDNISADSSALQETSSAQPVDEISVHNSQDDLTNILDDIGLATAASAATEGEIEDKAADTIEKAAETADSVLNIAETGIEIDQELTDIPNDSAEPIVFDDIDTSELDNIPADDEQNYQEETISFENLDINNEIENTDFIDQIDNKISFDDIEVQNEIESEQQTSDNLEDTISLDNIDTSFMDELTALPNIDEETLSLDDITETNIRPDMSLTENTDNSVSLTDLPIQEDVIEETANDNVEENLLAFDTNDAYEGNEQPPQNHQNITADNFDDFADLEELSIDAINDDIQNTEIADSQQNTQENTDFQALNEISDIENSNTETEIQTPENNEDSGSFGQNLLENMTEENISNISIEDIGLDNTSINQNVEEITSDELMSQIDNLLNVNDTVPENTDDVISQTNPATQLDEKANEEITDSNSDDIIPDIDDLLSSSTDSESEQPQGAEAQSPEIPDTNSELSQTDLNDLDELLNMADFNDGNQNYPEESTEEDTDKLGVLYNDTDPVSDTDLDSLESYTPQQDDNMPQQQVPGAAFLKQKKSSKKALLTTAALITVLAGASAFVFLKPKSDVTSDIETPSSSDIINNPEHQRSPENILESNAPAITKKADTKQEKSKQIKELKNTATAKKPISTESYLDVKRLVWDVPDALSYSPKIQNYLRTAGRSIKLSLSADLLLASEYAYSNQVKVALTLDKSGNLKDSKIVLSSGSSEIDKIVLQSVKDTLNVIKPPSNEISTPDFNLNLIIYF